MNAGTLRQLWTVVEDTQPPLLLMLNDTDLIKQLLSQLQNRYMLTGEEVQMANVYLRDRLSLIRDMAQA
ncbi:MAG TPA: hypothetical protein V6D19_10260 [Stenomitos sp.]